MRKKPAESVHRRSCAGNPPEGEAFAPSSSRPPRGRLPGIGRQGRFIFGGVAAVCFLLYLPTVRYDFVWDDQTAIRDNPHLAETGPLGILTSGFVLNPQAGGALSYYRPLPNLSFFVEHRLFGRNPAGYHLTNVVLHALVVLLLCIILWELYRSRWLAAGAGLLFGAHPAMNNVVAFIANRTYLLAALFLLAAFLALLKGRAGTRRKNHRDTETGKRGQGRLQIADCRMQNTKWADGRRDHRDTETGRVLSEQDTGKKPASGRARLRSVRMVLFGLAFLLALLAMESALVFGVVALGWLALKPREYRPLRGWVSAVVLPLAGYFVLRLVVARVPFESRVLETMPGQGMVLLNATGRQVLQFLFPFGQKLVYTLTPGFAGFSGYTLAALLFLLAPLAGLALVFRRGKARAARFEPGLIGYGWGVGFLLPFAHLLFLGPAGRMLYLAGPGLLILILALLPRPATGRRARLLAGITVLYAAAFWVRTAARNPVWQDDAHLFHTMVREAPQSASAHHDLGLVLYSRGLYDSALARYETAIALAPDFAQAYGNRGRVHHLAGDFDRGREDYSRALGLDSTLYPTYKNRGDIYALLGEFDRALKDYNRALRLAPGFADAYNDRGCIYLMLGNREAALQDFNRALRYDSLHADAYGNRGRALFEAGDYGQARADLDRALRLDPGFVLGYLNRGDLFRALGECGQALADYERALALDPHIAPAHFGRARCLELDGRVREALAGYERFLGLAGPEDRAQADTARARIRALAGQPDR